MEEPIERSGAWVLTPLIYSLNPMECVGSACVGVQAPARRGEISRCQRSTGQGSRCCTQGGDTVAACANACIGGRRAVIGGNVVVTAKGAEELNAIPLGK